MRGTIKQQLMDMVADYFTWLHDHLDQLPPVLRGIFYGVAAHKTNIANGVVPSHTATEETVTTLQLNVFLQNIYKEYLPFRTNCECHATEATAVRIDEDADEYVVRYGDHVTLMHALSRLGCREEAHVYHSKMVSLLNTKTRLTRFMGISQIPHLRFQLMHMYQMKQTKPPSHET